MSKQVIGHIDCPVCGFHEMEVKEDKNNHAYGHCTDCNAQVFTRNDYRNGKLRARMRSVTVTVTVPEASEPTKAPTPAPTTAPTRAPTPTPTAAPKPRAGFFTPLLGVNNG